MLSLSGEIQLDRLIQCFGNILSVLFSLANALCKQIFNLPVYGAKVVLCPGCDGVVEFRREPKRDLLFFFRHGLVQAAGIDNGLSILVAAEHDKQIGYHCCLSLFIQLHNIVFIELFQRHFHHTDGSVHDHFACVDNS